LHSPEPEVLIMWDSLSPAWQACLEEAWAADCAGSVPIGAAVADAHGQVIARGRNRIADKRVPRATASDDEQRTNRAVFNHDLAHAELNALLSLPLVDWDKATPNSPRQWTLYTTMEPCPLCLGAFYMSGLRQLYYAARDPYAGSVNLLGATPYLSRKPIQVLGPRPELEPLSIALIVESMLQDSMERAQWMCDQWRPTAPLGVALGQRLFDQQILQPLRSATGTAAEMVSLVMREMEALAGLDDRENPGDAAVSPWIGP
jgi:tRNA(adenine34) deaminase